MNTAPSSDSYESMVSDGTPSSPPAALTGDAWLEMTASIPAVRREGFAAWMDTQLAAFEIRHADEIRKRPVREIVR